MVTIAYRFAWIAQQSGYVTIRLQFTKCIASLLTIKSKLSIARLNFELFTKQSELFAHFTGIWRFGKSKLLIDKPESIVAHSSFAGQSNVFASVDEFVFNQLASINEPIIPSTKCILTIVATTIRKFELFILR